MKNTAMFLVWFTTIFLVVLTVLASTAIGFQWYFLLVILGHILVVVVVYKVLTDNYTTDKTFDKFFYQDHSIQRNQD
ncbi:MAG: hypothetical protein QNJ57_02295 [Flavobacteriaceae bacterium]|nr:hypothetical protein [Flavobacteriaceae bacterium]